MRAKALLLDGNSLINRAFFALPLLTNSAGTYTSAVYGFINIMLKLYDEESPEYLAVAFDLPGPTLRHKQFSDYKATRKSMPQELRPQLSTLKELLTKMGIAIFELDGFEADDILGTLATKVADMGLHPIVVSGDRDLLQLCTDILEVRIPKTKGGRTEIERYFAADVEASIGVTPTQYIDVKALMGDSSDNIPGVAGIGEKTAVKIIRQYGSLEDALANVSSIKPAKAAESLEQNRDIAILSKQLATIITDIPLEFSQIDIAANNMYNEDSLNEVRRLEFRSLISRFSRGELPENTEKKGEQQASQAAQQKYTLIQSAEDIEAVIKKSVLNSKEIAVSCLCESNGGLVGVSISVEPHKAVFIPIDTKDKDSGSTLESLRPLLDSEEIVKYLPDLKASLMLLAPKGFSLPGAIDTSLAAYMVNSSKNAYAYDDIASDILGEHLTPLDSILGKGRTRRKLAQLEPAELLNLACRESDTTLRAAPALMKSLEDTGQQTLYNEVELPLARVLQDMQAFGISVSRTELEAFGARLDENISEVSREIFTLCGEEFNLNSPSQLGVVLFEKMGLKGSKKTKTGYSTAADVLEKLRGTHPAVGRVLKYRTYAKLKSTYVDGLLPLISPETGKIHSTFSQTVASTGRISSSEPNLQNIPVRLEIGRELRRAFVPSSPDFIFLDGDYSQIELRVLAGLSGDKSLIQAFEQGQDIHRLTASQVFDTPFELVTSAQRNAAKAVNFGIIYGIGAYSLSQDLDITVKEAEAYIKGYFERYPKIKDFMDESVSSAKNLGYAQTYFGRRRPIAELSSQNFNLRSFGERAAMNMPIQGTAADIIKIAMIRVHRRLTGMRSRLILQVHDELLLEVHREEADVVKNILQEEMTAEIKLGGRVLPVPLECNFSFGESWYDTK